MIQAKIVADSLAPNGARLTTLEVIMPRMILAEFNTHRMLSRNSASSRAIPFKKMVKNVQDNPFIPIAWQKEHSGMQGTEYIENRQEIRFATDRWLHARNNAILNSIQLTESEVTKQLANRLLEPFMYHKVLVSATEWENFFELRCPKYTLNNDDIFKSKKDFKTFYKEAIENVENHLALPLFAENADNIAWLKCNKGQSEIHMMALAESIYDAINESTPKRLEYGEWHIPYGDNIDISLDQKARLKIAVARCARLSYQTLGDNPVIDYSKDLELFNTLYTSKHYSPFEHVARVMSLREYKNHVKGRENAGDKYGWSANYRGFIQYRNLI